MRKSRFSNLKGLRKRERERERERSIANLSKIQTSAGDLYPGLNVYLYLQVCD